MLVICIQSFFHSPEVTQGTCQTLCWGVTITDFVAVGLTDTHGQLSTEVTEKAAVTLDACELMGIPRNE